MSLAALVRGRWCEFVRARAIRRVSQQPARFTLEPARWDGSLDAPKDFYLECLRYFYQQLPPPFQEHREYFRKNQRGFGEDAFHTMWYLLLRQFQPKSFLEIGVYRGQVLSLVALWAKLSGVACFVQGISPFTAAGDAVSKYRTDVDYYQDTLTNFQHFGLPQPELLRAYSTDPEAVQVITSHPWDMIYIDGNHDYEVVCKDWAACARSLKPGGVVVLDDASLFGPKSLPVFASRGHPGPSRLAEELDRKQFRELLRVGHNRAFLKLIG